MARRLGLLLFAAAIAVVLGADDPWAKVRALKSGQELRIWKKGGAQRAAMEAKMDEATDERLLVVVKNEQVAIAKEDVERLEARPVRTTSRVQKETKETYEASKTGAMPSRSVSSGVTIGDKPAFELIYTRRPAPPPPPARLP